MRDEKIDLLRFIGVAMLILAHVAPPGVLFQLRNFDAPMMVLLSGVSFGLSGRNESYAAYVWARIKRLVLPVWIFLTAYFALIAATGRPIHFPDTQKLILSYTLISGIGYVWIIRVFLLVALVAPFILQLRRRIPRLRTFFGVLAVLAVLFEILRDVVEPLDGGIPGELLKAVFLFLPPFAIVFAVGLCVRELTRRQTAMLAVVSLAVFVVLGYGLYVMEGRLVPTQEYKYPPSLYYLSYALGVSALLWLLSGRLLTILKATPLYAPALFVGRNSMWIYLWHIPLLEVIRLDYAFKYPLVFTLAAVLTYLQVSGLQRLVLPRIGSAVARKNLNLLLTG